MSEKSYRPTTDADLTLDELAQRRASLSGPPGVRGVLLQPRLALLAAITTLGALCYGIEQGAYSQVLAMPSFTNDPRFARIASDSAFKGWSVSTLGAGGIFGALVNGYTCDVLSRRWAMFVGAIICLLGTGLTTGATAVSHMFVGRFFIGWAVGGLSAAVPMYNSEVAPAELRGTVVATQQCAIVTGILISFWVGYGTNFISDTNSAAWRVCLAIQGVPAILLALCCVFVLPYSPRWLASKGRYEEAAQSLSWIRNRPVDDELVKLEMLEIRAEAEFEAEINAERYPSLANGRGGPLRIAKLQLLAFSQLFTSRHMMKRTGTAAAMMFFQQATGIDAIVYYAPSIFASLGLPGRTTSLLASGVIGIVFVLSTIPAVITIDLIGRKALLLIGIAIMGTSMVLVTALVGSFEGRWLEHEGAGWATAVFIWIYVGGFGASLGPVSWTIISEVFPASTRAHGTSFGAAVNWLSNFAISIAVPVMLEKIKYGTYLVFLVLLIIMAFWVIFLLPETAGKSLEEMDYVFGSGEGKQDAERMQRIQRDLLEQSRMELFEDPSTRAGKLSGNEKRELV